jgi:predicted O-methyltransferase YrrM
VFWKYGRKPPRRYKEILNHIARNNVRSIVEIGVYTGIRAMEMITAAKIHHHPSEISYSGFDLFEEMTPELCAKEFSKIPLSEAVIHEYLLKTGAKIELRKGYSQETLPLFVSQHAPVDLVFIDGGHAIETIESDWKNIELIMGPSSVVYFDDYYVNDPKDVVGIGCQTLIDGLDTAKYDVRVGKIEDRFAKPWGTLKIRLASVSLRSR